MALAGATYLLGASSFHLRDEKFRRSCGVMMSNGRGLILALKLPQKSKVAMVILVD
jgi:hypothetical protein